MDMPSTLDLFQTLLIKITPLYGIMLMGFFFGRKRPQSTEPLAFFLIYFISPVIVGGRVAQLDFQPHYLLLPVIIFLICCAVGLIAYAIGHRLQRDNVANVIAYMSGCSNYGNYGIPVAMLLFPAELVCVYMLALCGFILFDSTLGYYLAARGLHSPTDSLRRLIRLPTLYAGAAGVIFSALHFHLPPVLVDTTNFFLGTQTVIGCMMIGMGLSRIGTFAFEPKLIAMAFAFKFLLWPALALATIALDTHALHIFSTDIHKMLMLFAVLPMPVNAIAYATHLNIHTERVSFLVFLSTIFALLYLPLAMALWG